MAEVTFTRSNSIIDSIKRPGGTVHSLKSDTLFGRNVASAGVIESSVFPIIALAQQSPTAIKSGKLGVPVIPS